MIRRCILLAVRRGAAWLALPLVLASLLTSVLAACAPGASSRPSGSTASPTTTSQPANVYHDPKLGFSLALPDGWSAASYPGSRGTASTTAVVVRDPAKPAALVTIGVIHSASMSTAFAARGTPTLRIGAYSAFQADTTIQQGRVPCDVRILLAAQDYVLADWCAMDAPDSASQLEQLLATYQPAPAHFTPAAQLDLPPSQTCSRMQQELGYEGSVSWGRTLASPDATSPALGWGSLAPGVSVCSNTGSSDPYLFQCTELVNRFDLDVLGLAHIPGNAARYFDYYDDATMHPGDARDLPAGTYAFSDDASQGKSAFVPRPGDLLIFQDVNNPRSGWTSGLTGSPGHIALITAVDGGHVYVAQENYNDRRYFMALTLTTSANGYHISDSSGIGDRIVRGWVRFTLPP